MIFQLSQKLNNKIKVGTLPALPLDENPFADWSAHVFRTGRTHYILLCNTKSLYSIVFPGKGITNENTFIKNAKSSIREFLDAEGQTGVYQHWIAPDSDSVQFAKSLNRSITGSMNDMIRHAAYWLESGEVSPIEIGSRLKEIPMSALRQDGTKYGFPQNVFAEMVKTEDNNDQRMDQC